jgi:hypothetical protein
MNQLNNIEPYNMPSQDDENYYDYLADKHIEKAVYWNDVLRETYGTGR